MSRTTIARTATRKIAEIKAGAWTYKVYNLRHDFIAFEPVNGTDWIWTAIEQGQAKLQANEKGGYTVTWHSNSWVELIPRESADVPDRP
jgi:hypothetical protein